MHNRDGPRPRGNKVSVVLLNGRADDNPFGSGDDARTILREQADATAGQLLQDLAVLIRLLASIRPGNSPPRRTQRLRDSAHADPRHADQMVRAGHALCVAHTLRPPPRPLPRMNSPNATEHQP